MATKIRLARIGAKKQPFYKIVVADVRASRDGKFIEKLGNFNPLLPKDNPNRLVINSERVKYWLGIGAVPTERVENFLVDASITKRSARSERVKQKRLKVAQDKKQKAAAKKAAEEAAAAKAAEAPAA